jgi:hypothetical protein
MARRSFQGSSEVGGIVVWRPDGDESSRHTELAPVLPSEHRLAKASPRLDETHTTRHERVDEPFPIDELPPDDDTSRS